MVKRGSGPRGPLLVKQLGLTETSLRGGGSLAEVPERSCVAPFWKRGSRGQSEDLGRATLSSLAGLV